MFTIGVDLQRGQVIRILGSHTDRAGLEVKGLAFHAQTRAGVRRKEFRQLPSRVQEALTRTEHETLRKGYDDVWLDEMREAVETLSKPLRQRGSADQISSGVANEALEPSIRRGHRRSSAGRGRHISR